MRSRSLPEVAACRAPTTPPPGEWASDGGKARADGPLNLVPYANSICSANCKCTDLKRISLCIGKMGPCCLPLTSSTAVPAGTTPEERATGSCASQRTASSGPTCGSSRRSVAGAAQFPPAFAASAQALSTAPTAAAAESPTCLDADPKALAKPDRTPAMSDGEAAGGRGNAAARHRLSAPASDNGAPDSAGQPPRTPAKSQRATGVWLPPWAR
mmetsp:Transcript_99854/g.298252  ORF Transcript_99854/g.298252 Transcript_99854/m.298252 type:complete len:214 (-) Transcript_99854:463-1104(-)